MLDAFFIVSYIALFFSTIVFSLLTKLYQNRSEKDVNTNCYNLQWFNTNIVKWMLQSKKDWRPFGLLMLDIDNFKQVNDTRGHAMGDLVLEKLVQVLQESVRFKKSYKFNTAQDFAIRRSGDEFLFVLKNVHLKALEIIANRISKKINETVIHDFNKEEVFHMSASIGGTIYEPFIHDVNVSALMEKVDQAMYNSKSAGKNCVSILV